MKHILIYITGHGYGHFTRTFEVIKQVHKLDSDIYFHIKTSAPAWLTRHILKQNFTFYNLSIDVGAVQQNSYHVDKETTLKMYAELLQRKEKIVRQELDFIKENKVELIVADIPPLAFDIAHSARIPGIGIGNFSWDWIYEPYIKEFPHYRFVGDDIKNSHAKADLLIRLPLHGDMTSFPIIEDFPLIARKSATLKQNVLELLNLPPEFDKKMILIALRPYDLDRMDMQSWKKLKSCFFVIPDSVFRLDKNILTIPSDYCLFEDLVMASDLVVSKPGYGIVSECIANDTPLLYTSRDNFVEYDVLVEGMNKYLPNIFVPREEFVKGKWADNIHFDFRNDQVENIGIDGAEKAAKRILSFLE